MAKFDELYRVYSVIHSYNTEEGIFPVFTQIKKYIYLSEKDLKLVLGWLVLNDFITKININKKHGIIPPQIGYKIPERYIMFDELYKIYKEMDIPESELKIQFHELID